MPSYYYGHNILCPTAPCHCHRNRAEEWVCDSCCVGTYTTAGCGGSSSVLLSSGMFSFKRDLMSLAAVNGISWGFGIDYLAGNGVDDILGKGFNFPQYLQLQSLPGGNVQMASGQNTLELFLQAGPGQYAAPDTNNTRAELYRGGSGASDQFTLRASDGTVTQFFGFDPAIPTPGRLQSITDRYGNRQSYAWQLTGGMIQLLSVTDAYGRSINYSYFGSEFGYRLQEITDFLGRQLNFQFDNLGHLVAVVTPSILKGATGNTFPGGTAFVFQWDVNNPRADRQDDLVKIWFPNEAAPFIDHATRTVNVQEVYQSATPRYSVGYGQDPTDGDMYGRTLAEIIGDPANGVGGAFNYLYTTDGLPENIIDPSDPIARRCVVTDRNDNQRVYDFNAAQMPVRVEVMRSRGKINIPSIADFPSYVTWTSYNSHNQPLLQVMPLGNSVQNTYEDGTVPGISGIYNRRAGLPLSRTLYPDNSIGIESPGGSSGQTQLTETFFHDPIFNQPCARIERRGNPINGSGGYFAPQNQTPSSPPTQAARYATITYYDYQKDSAANVQGDTTLQALLSLSNPQIGDLISFVSNQLTGATLAAFATSLGDINGDGTGIGSAEHVGNVVQIQHPTAYLVGASAVAQTRIEIFTSNALGQTTTRTDENGNLTVFVRYPYNDPEGDGGMAAFVPTELGGKQYGRIKEIHVDSDPDDVLSLVGGDGDLVDFQPNGAIITRTNTPGVYLDLVTRYEGGSGSGGSGCASCAYDPMGNPLAETNPRGFTTRYDRNELGEIYRTIAPQPYNFPVETYFDANRNVTRVDTQDWQPAFDSSDPASASYAQFTPSGSNSTAHVAMRPGPGGSVRPGWFTNLFTFNLLDNLTQQDIDATGATPANLVTGYLYDPNQNRIQTTLPEGNLVEEDYDERDFRIAVRVGNSLPSASGGSVPATPAVTITAHDANGSLLQVIGPVNRGGTTGTAVIEDAFRSGAILAQTGDLAVSNILDGFDRVIQAIDPLGNFVDTGADVLSSGNPFLDPDGRVIQSDSYQPTNVLLASSQFRFDEAGRQYEAQHSVLIATNVLPLPSGRPVTHTGGGLAANSTANNHTGTVALTTPGNTSYVLTRTIFDAGGRTVATLDDNTGQTSFNFDGADRRIQAIDALTTNPNIVTYSFDAAGNLIGITRNEYCTISGVSTVETFSSAMFYDCLNRLVLSASQGADGNFIPNVLGLAAAGGVSFWELSPWNLSASTLISCMARDSRGNQVLGVDPKGNSVVTVVDGASRTVQTQRHLRQAGQGQNPPAANQTLLPASDGTIVTTLILDGNGRKTEVIDDRGDITQFVFDTLDRQIQMIFQDGSTRTSVYDQAGDVVTYTDENSNVFTNTFDALGRKTSVNIAVNPDPEVDVSTNTQSQSSQFDGLSRMTFARDSNQPLGGPGAINADVTLVYDSIGRVLEDAQEFYNNPRYVTNTAFTSYPVSGFTFPSGRVINSGYDLLYRRTSVADSGPSNIAIWDFFGPARLARVQLGTSNNPICTWMNNAGTNSAVQGGTPGVPNPAWGSASTDRLGYDGAGRMIAKRYLISGGSIPVVAFTTAFDRAGNKFYERPLHAENRGHLYEPFDGNGLPTGGYDSLDRLLQYQRGTLASTGGDGGNGGGSISSIITLTNTDTQRTYTLDGLGNWRNTTFTPQATGILQTEVRQHDGLNQITRLANPLAATPLINPTYDLNGNLQTDGTRTYTWDVLNRLAEADDVAGDIGEYHYDALNRRVRKTAGGVKTDFIYSGWQCVEERTPPGGADTPTMQYVWGIYLDEIIQLKLLVAVNDFPANQILYPLQDLLYRTTALADTSSPPKILEAYDMDAYGNTLIFRNTSGGSVVPITFTSDSQAVVPTCPFIFTGQRFDSETGLYYYKNRYYMSVYGRFLSRDLGGLTRAYDSRVAPMNAVIQSYENEGGAPDLFMFVGHRSNFPHSGGNNEYAYCNSSPANWLDPNGFRPCTPDEWRKANADCDKRAKRRAALLGLPNLHTESVQCHGETINVGEVTYFYAVWECCFIGCSAAEKKKWYAEQTAACAPCRKCQAGMTPTQLTDMWSCWSKCKSARIKIMLDCYLGGDAGHNEAYDNASRAEKNCLELMR